MLGRCHSTRTHAVPIASPAHPRALLRCTEAYSEGLRPTTARAWAAARTAAMAQSCNPGLVLPKKLVQLVVVGLQISVLSRHAHSAFLAPPGSEPPAAPAPHCTGNIAQRQVLTSSGGLGESRRRRATPTAALLVMSWGQKQRTRSKHLAFVRLAASLNAQQGLGRSNRQRLRCCKNSGF